MRPNRFALATLAAAATIASADALAFNCYIVIDKDQNVVFRATRPPFGMDGDDWKKGQDDLRAKNHHLRWTFTPDCFPQITEVRKAYATTRTGDAVFDPAVVLGNTPEYMTATGRPTSSQGGYPQ
jgi:hypothetical protein